MNKEVIIIATPLRFYCTHDEEAFFEWLNKIPDIIRIQGVGKELHLYFDAKEKSLEVIRSLYGAFKRYKFKNIDQLKIFMNKENKYLFE